MQGVWSVFFFVFFVKSELLNCKPVTLEKRDRFAKGFFEMLKL